MPSIESLTPFIVATLVFAFIPGPGMFYMSIQTMARGRSAGWLSAAGFHLGAYVHIGAAAFGITALLQVVPTLFVILKLVGAGYLVWMGARLIMTARRRPTVNEPSTARTTRQAFRDSLAVEILNPKTALFWLAFPPQFASPDASAPIWMQIVLLGTFANMAFTATDAICIALAEKVAAWAAASQTSLTVAQRVGGSLFVAMGCHLALQNK